MSRGEPAGESKREVVTACNCRVRYSKDLPQAEYQGEVVYFCLPACKEDFERAPEGSCWGGSHPHQNPFINRG